MEVELKVLKRRMNFIEEEGGVLDIVIAYVS